MNSNTDRRVVIVSNDSTFNIQNLIDALNHDTVEVPVFVGNGVVDSDVEVEFNEPIFTDTAQATMTRFEIQDRINYEIACNLLDTLENHLQETQDELREGTVMAKSLANETSNLKTAIRAVGNVMTELRTAGYGESDEYEQLLQSIRNLNHLRKTNREATVVTAENQRYLKALRGSLSRRIELAKFFIRKMEYRIYI